MQFLPLKHFPVCFLRVHLPLSSIPNVQLITAKHFLVVFPFVAPGNIANPRYLLQRSQSNHGKRATSRKGSNFTYKENEKKGKRERRKREETPIKIIFLLKRSCVFYPKGKFLPKEEPFLRSESSPLRPPPTYSPSTPHSNGTPSSPPNPTPIPTLLPPHPAPSSSLIFAPCNLQERYQPEGTCC